jgi:hypothetical protein
MTIVTWIEIIIGQRMKIDQARFMIITITVLTVRITTLLQNTRGARGV